MWYIADSNRKYKVETLFYEKFAIFLVREFGCSVCLGCDCKLLFSPLIALFVSFESWVGYEDFFWK